MINLDLKKIADPNYEKEALEELQSKLLNSEEFKKGKVQTQMYPEDVADAIEALFFLQEFSEVTLKLKKEGTGNFISMEILSKK
jgi:hypothetical protein